MTTRQCEMENDYAQQCLASALGGSDYCDEHRPTSLDGSGDESSADQD